LLVDGVAHPVRTTGDPKE